MKKKALRKDFYMEIRKSWGRFLSIFFIVAIGTAFFSGIRSAEPDMRISGDAYFDEYQLMDLQVISPIGLTKSDVQALEEIDGVKKVEAGYSLDALCKDGDSEKVVHVFSIQDTLNQLHLEKGRMPKEANECVIDDAFLEKSDYQIGDEISLNSGSELEITMQLQTDTYTIVGTVSSPQYISFQRGSSMIGTGTISGFLAVLQDSFKMNGYTEAAIQVKGAEEFTAFTDDYDEKIDDVKDEIEELNDSQMWYINDRRSLPEYNSYGENADRMRAIGQVFPVLFFLVAALISLTTMTRMVEEQRTQIGTLKALGYSRYLIASKYIGYAFCATIGGSIFGVLIGEKILPYIIVTAYGILYPYMDSVCIPYHAYYGIYATVAALVCTLAATIFSCVKELQEQAAELMRPPAPKQGKRVLLERIPFIWKHLNFIWKATIRNLIRYKKRFFMTVFGIGGCMALLLVGFGLRDSIFNIAQLQYHELNLYDANLILNPEMSSSNKEEIINVLQEENSVEKVTSSLLRQITLENEETKKEAYLSVPQDKETFQEFVVFRDRRTKKEYTLQDTGVIITEKLSNMLGVKKGDTILLQDGEYDTFTVEIADICENYMGNYIFMTSELYESVYGESPQYNSVYFSMKEGQEEKVNEVGEKILKEEGTLSISYSTALEGQVEDMLDSLNIVLVVLIISAGMLAFVVLYNLNSINITERRRELATIKVLGFYDNEVSAYVYRENIILTLIGALVGMILGKILHQFVIVTVEIDSAMFGRTINVWSFIYGFLITMGFSLIVNIVMYFKLKKIDMVESLKSVE